MRTRKFCALCLRPLFVALALFVPTLALAASVTWSGATTITSGTTQSGKTYTSTTADQNSLLINTSGNVTITKPTVKKSGGTSASDNYSFYGTNSGIMCKGGGTTTITGGTVTTSTAGANGVFSYGANSGQTNATGDGTTVKISDTTIKTTGAGSGGIMTTFGGTTVANNLTVTTTGGSSAPIRTDRGGGWVTVTGGSYTSSGLGSPAIYSTADVEVSGATLVSKLSEGVCIEGNGSISLSNCKLTASNTKKNGNAQYLDTIMIYQSMSGDATGTGSEFSMSGGTLTSNSGHVFHVTNTSATINLSGTSIVNNDSGDVLLSVVNDGWSGNANSAVVNASGQTLKGSIIVSSKASSKSSSASSLTLNLKKGSAFSGTISDGANGKNFKSAAVNIDSTSSWTLTGNSYVSKVTSSGTINYGSYTLYVNGTAYTASNPYNASSYDDSSSDDQSDQSGNSSQTNPGGQNGPGGSGSPDGNGSNPNGPVPGSERLIEDGTYLIESDLQDGMLADVSYGSTSNGANIATWRSNGGKNQQFQLTWDSKTNAYIIKSVKSGLLLDVQRASTSSGANVIQWSSNGGLNQRWTIVADGDGYQIRSANAPQLALTVSGSVAKARSNVSITTNSSATNQRFHFLSTSQAAKLTASWKTISDGTYMIAPSHATNLTLDIRYASKNNGGNLIAYTASGAANQQFELSFKASYGYYTVRNVNSGLYLDVAHATAKAGTNVIQWAYNGGLNQFWDIRKSGKGYVLVSALSPNLVLDVAGASTKSGANVELWTAKSAANQLFYLSEV